ncbi:MAG: hypothetical protein WCJ30_18265, partial [Deltaproteobacteria bacterium]
MGPALVVHVLETESNVNPGAAIAGASVTVDTLDGRRVERMTNSAGDVAFAPADGLVGPLDVTAYVTGHGTRVSRPDARVVPDLRDVVAVSVGAVATCAATGDGSLYCWGEPSNGRLGYWPSIDTRTPQLVRLFATETQPVVGVSVGANHSCALLGDGRVVCFGENDGGQLGNGGTQSSAESSFAYSADSAVHANGRITAVAAGAFHSCAVTDEGRVLCWGGNLVGEIGRNAPTNPLFPVEVPLRGVVDVSAGAHATCARVQTGEVHCWGANGVGQLGDGTTTSRTLPVQVLGLRARQVVLSDSFGCALTDPLPPATSEIDCWSTIGSGAYFSLGHYDDFTLPTAISTAGDIVRIAMTEAQSCALHANGSVGCWGQNFYDGFDLRRITNIPFTSAIADIAVGRLHLCASSIDGNVWCFGDNQLGQIGTGNTAPTPGVTRVAVSDAVSLAA